MNLTEIEGTFLGGLAGGSSTEGPVEGTTKKDRGGLDSVYSLGQENKLGDCWYA